MELTLWVQFIFVRYLILVVPVSFSSMETNERTTVLISSSFKHRYFICHWYETYFQTHCSTQAYISKSSCLSDIQLCWCQLQNFRKLSIRKRLCFRNIFICKLTAVYKEKQSVYIALACLLCAAYIFQSFILYHLSY